MNALERPSTAQLLRYFLYLGSLGFGGPGGPGRLHAAGPGGAPWVVHRDEYMKGLALSQLAPGPLAAQLAICLGYVHSRVLGATLVGLPSSCRRT